MSTREQIVARMAAVLASSGTPVYRARQDALDRGSLPAIVLRSGDEETTPLSERIEVSRLNVHLEVLVRGEEWETLSDAIIVTAHGLLLGDAQLAVLCSKLRRTGAKWDGHEADQTAGSVTQTYHLQYRTATNQL